jgi:hypothetical protein
MERLVGYCQAGRSTIITSEYTTTRSGEFRKTKTATGGTTSAMGIHFAEAFACPLVRA